MAGWDAGTSGATRTWNTRGSKSRPAGLASDPKIEQYPSFKAHPTFIMVCSSHSLSQASSNLLQAAFNPTQIFGDEVTEEKGENARLSAFVGAIAVGDLVKSTLGPKGMDKILQSAYVTLHMR